MEEKFDMILNNQAKMLEHLTLLTKDVNQLKIGQKRLEEGQEELKIRVTSLEGKVVSLENRVDAVESKVDAIETKVDIVIKNQQDSKEELTWIHEYYLKTRKRVEKLEEK